MALWAWFLEEPWPVIVTVVLVSVTCCVALVCLFLWLWDRRLTEVVRRPQLDFEFPEGDDQRLFLVVANRGASRDFSVQARVRGAHICSGYRESRYKVPWESGGHSKDHTLIESGRSANLSVAALHRDGSQVTMSLQGLSEHRFDHGYDIHEVSDKPALKLELEFSGQGLPETLRKTFWISPETREGPLRLSENEPQTQFEKIRKEDAQGPWPKPMTKEHFLSHWDELLIHWVGYGRARRLDVTGKIKSLVKDNRISLKIENELFPIDPVSGKSKTLTVCYSHGHDRCRTIEVNEGDFLDLPPQVSGATQKRPVRAT